MLAVAALALAPVAASQSARSIAQGLERETVVRLGTPVRRHRGAATAVAFGPDGRRAASAGWDGAVRLWRTRDGEPDGALVAEASGLVVHDVRFDPDGRVAASGSDRVLRVWDARRERELAAIELPSACTIGALAPDGARWFGAGALAQDVVAVDLDAEEVGAAIPVDAGLPTALAVAPDGATLAIGTSHPGAIVLVDLADPGAERRVLAAPSDVAALAFTADGARLVAAVPTGLVAYDVAAGSVRARVGGHEGPSRGVAVAADGSRAWTGTDDGRVLGYRLEGAEPDDPPFLDAPRFDGAVAALALDPDGELLLGAGVDGRVRFLDAATGDEVRAPPGHRDAVTALAWSPEGKRLVSTAADGTACVWERRRERLEVEVQAHPTGAFGVDWGPRGRTFTTCGGDGALVRWSARGKEEARRDLGEAGGRLASLDLDRAGEVAVTALAGAGLLRWELDGDAEPEVVGDHDLGVVDARLSSEDSRVAAVDGSGTLRVHDVARGDLLVERLPDRARFTSVAWLDVRNVAAGADTGAVSIFNGTTGDVVGHVALGDGGGKPVVALAASPDGATLASAGESGVWLWRAGDWRRRAAMRTPDGRITRMAWHPEEPLVALGMEDGTVLLWDLSGLEDD